MKTKRVLFLIILIITIRAGFAQEGEKQIEYPNLVKNGDFEKGNVGFKSDFIFAEDFWDWGYYIITDNVDKYSNYSMGSIFLNPIPRTGKYYAVQVNNSGKQRLWYDSITVKPNTAYEFSCILATINGYPPANMRLKINGKAHCSAKLLSNSSKWELFSVQYKTGPDETRIEISVVDAIWSMMGNDVALDNIVFKEIPPEEFVDCNE